MAKAEIAITVDTSAMEKTLQIIARHFAALAAELRQAREYPHGTTDDRGRPIRPDGTPLGERTSPRCGRLTSPGPNPCTLLTGHAGPCCVQWIET